MAVLGFYSKNFRNLKTPDLKFDPGFIVFTGGNGAGKSNVLEALYFSLTLTRFPESELRHLFLSGENYFQIRSRVINNSADDEGLFLVTCQSLGQTYQRKLFYNKRLVVKGEYTKLANGAVYFLPTDLNLFSGSPARRRMFFDTALNQTDQGYQRSVSSYQRILKQRNEVLLMIREGKATFSDLDIWDKQLVESGVGIVNKRTTLAQFLEDEIIKTTPRLVPKLNQIELVYSTTGSNRTDRFFEKLKDQARHEVRVGATTIGPHRDDFILKVNKEPAVGKVSRGQMRGLIIALKLAAHKYLEQYFGTPPIFIFDDVFSELDTDHQQYLIRELSSCEQVFISTTHQDEIKKILPTKAQLFFIDEGEVSHA